jgi:glutamine synthetase adenylyltransferase
MQSVRKGISEVARQAPFPGGLAEMRRRLEEIDRNDNFKTGPGGSFDIDYLTGCLQAKHGVWTVGNFCARIADLRRCGLLSAKDAASLSENATFLRSLEHYVRLVTGRPGKWVPASDHAQSCVVKLMGWSSSRISALGGKLAEVLRRNREIYLQYPF